MAARVSRAHGAGHLIEPRVQQHPVLAGQAPPDLRHAVGDRGDHHLAFDGGSPPPLEHRVGFTGEDDPVDLGTEGGRVAGPSPIHRGRLDHGQALVTDVLGAFDDDPDTSEVDISRGERPVSCGQPPCQCYPDADQVACRALRTVQGDSNFSHRELPGLGVPGPGGHLLPGPQSLKGGDGGDLALLSGRDHRLLFQGHR